MLSFDGTVVNWANFEIPDNVDVGFDGCLIIPIGFGVVPFTTALKM